MSDDNKNINNQYLIGSKPETIKADIMNFKEDVLVDFKELSKKLDQKYKKINKELKDNMESFNNKMSSFNQKILELNSKIVTDSNTREKLSELLNFKDNAEYIINTNKKRISMITEEAHDKINQINSILSGSLSFPGLIGALCKFKSFREFMEFIYTQIIELNNYKNKNLIEFGVYKTKIEYSLNSMKNKIDNNQKELKNYISERLNKTEGKILEEFEIRDEKFKNFQEENEDYFFKLENEMRKLNDEVKIVKVMKEEINRKVKELEAKNGENYVNILEKYNYIENKIFNLQSNIQKTFSYLNKQGANLKIIKDEEIISPHSINIQDKIQIFKNMLSNQVSHINKNSDIIKNNSFNFKENAEQELKELNKNTLTERNTKDDEYGKKEKYKKRIGSSKGKESDITKYVNGEITAEEIGLSTTKRKHITRTFMNNMEEHLITKDEYQKWNLNNQQKNNEKKKEIYLKRNTDNNNEKKIKDDLNTYNSNTFENGKVLKTEKRKGRSLSAFKNLMRNDFNDLDAKFHSNGLSSKVDYKTSQNKNTNISTKLNKENNYNVNKNTLVGNNYTKISPPKRIHEIKNGMSKPNLNLIPTYKMVTLKNIDKELSALNLFINGKYNKNSNRLLSPIANKIDINRNRDEKKNFLIIENNELPPPTKKVIKVKKKVLNFEVYNSDRIINNKFGKNSNHTFNSEQIEFTK